MIFFSAFMLAKKQGFLIVSGKRMDRNWKIKDQFIFIESKK